MHLQSIIQIFLKKRSQLLNNLNLSNISAHEKIELTIKRIITNFTTKSALIKSFHKEMSVAPPNPTT